MKTAYCTHCQKVTMMKVTITELPVAGSEGKINKVTIETYHCLTCGLFTKSVEKRAKRVPLRLKEIEQDRKDYYSASQVKMKNKKWTSHKDLKKAIGL